MKFLSSTRRCSPVFLPSYLPPRKFSGDGLALLILAVAASTSFAEPRELLPDLDGVTFRGLPTAGQTSMKGTIRHVEVSSAGKWYGAQLVVEPLHRWTPGDTLMLTVELRATQADDISGEGWVVLAHQAPDTFAKMFRRERSVPREWTTLHFPFVSTSEVQPESSEVILGFGNRKQHIDVRRISLVNHGSTPVETLEESEETYSGREINAPWRAAADERIDLYRKAEMNIQVVNEQGEPIPEAVVTIEQTRHAFPFGSMVEAELLLSDTPDAQKYQEIVQQNFNRVVLGNDLKWMLWEKHPQRALDALQWLNERKIEVRGHTLVWPSFKKMYQTRQYKDDPEALDTYISDHILDEAGTVGDRVVQWDVVNEPYDNHDALDILGEEVMVKWFTLAREASPTTPLFINDYNILAGGGADSDHQDHYEQTIRNLIDGGAPLDGIGLQSHFAPPLTSMDKVWSLLNRFSKFGKPLQITEFDVEGDLQLQADYLRDFMTLSFSHPDVEGFLLWGFWAGCHYKPDSAIYNQDWTLRPAAEVWHDLVFNQWWTQNTTKTDAEGKTLNRVFFGDYTITVTTATTRKSITLSIDTPQGEDIRMVLSE